MENKGSNFICCDTGEPLTLPPYSLAPNELTQVQEHAKHEQRHSYHTPLPWMRSQVVVVLLHRRISFRRFVGGRSFVGSELLNGYRYRRRCPWYPPDHTPM